MFHEVLSVVHQLAEDGPAPGPSGGNSSTVIPALIGLAGLVLTALITGYFGTRGERRGGARAGPSQRQLDEATYDAAYAENERREACEHVAALQDRVEVLERALVLRGFAPWRFVTGEEDDDHASIQHHRPAP